jgi:hypothetical protein
MGELSRQDIAAASARGREAARTEARAASARYDPASGRIVVDLTNGATFAFPPKLAEGLAGASDAALSEVQVLGGGYGLHWESLDVDFTVPGLLAGIFGTRSWMARQAGRATSEAKAEAARANGLRGGRPKKAGSGAS